MNQNIDAIGRKAREAVQMAQTASAEIRGLKNATEAQRRQLVELDERLQKLERKP